MRLHFELTLTFGTEPTESSTEQHDSDHTGYLLDAGQHIGFGRETDA